MQLGCIRDKQTRNRLASIKTEINIYGVLDYNKGANSDHWSKLGPF